MKRINLLSSSTSAPVPVVGAEQLGGAERDAQRGPGGSEARHRLRGAGQGPHRGRIRGLQQGHALPNAHRR